MSTSRVLGNILWFIFGGFVSGLAFFPFGKEINYGGGAVSLIANIIWLIVTGIPMAIGNAVWGCLLCITIIGIPFGKQFFKIAKLSLMPFGATIS